MLGKQLSPGPGRGRGTSDLDGLSLSGSIEVESGNGQAITVGQCVSAASGGQRWVEGWARIDAATSTLGHPWFQLVIIPLPVLGEYVSIINSALFETTLQFVHRCCFRSPGAIGFLVRKAPYK